MKRMPCLVGVATLAVFLAGACSSGDHAESRGAASTKSAARRSEDPPPTADDVQLMDEAVRNVHANAFDVVPERVWAAQVQAAAEAFPGVGR